MSKFKIDDRVIVIEKNPLSLYLDEYPFDKRGIITGRGSGLLDSAYYVFIDGRSNFIHKSELSLDKQYYREERFKQILE